MRSSGACEICPVPGVRVLVGRDEAQEGVVAELVGHGVDGEKRRQARGLETLRERAR